jgi:antitoxin component YwqK of YwqJK toxin-antitoxin module
MKLLPLLLTIAMLFMWGVSCETEDAGSKKRSEEFAQPTDVEGVSCSCVVYYDDGKMKSCVLAREDTLSSQPLPEGTIVFFSREGVMESCFLQQDTEIQGHLCRGNRDNWQTAFHPNGKLKLAWLGKDEVIQGIPCAAASFWRAVFGGGAWNSFYENGSLASCKLADDTIIEGKSFKKGDRVTFDQSGQLKSEK